jgi:hypothetical protein
MDEIERYQQMNILPSSRIGWETKQTYTNRLIEAHSDGCLTDTEYEARLTWISNAQTIDQVLLAFKDLPLLRVTGVELTPGTLHTPTKHKRRNYNGDVRYSIFLIGTFTALSCFEIIQGNNMMFWYFLILTVFVAVFAIWRIHRHPKGH